VRRRLVAVVLVSGLMAGATVVSGASQQQQPPQPHAPCPDASTLPANLFVDGLLQPLVADMYALSATFREQCRRIALVPSVRVFLRPVSVREPLNGRARATIRRFSTGAMTADVRLPMPIREHEAIELIAHELEHVLEQIDRVDLARLAAARAGAARLADGAYETERARDAGRTVAAEALPDDDPPTSALTAPTPRLARPGAAVPAVWLRR
jgi:hypothetical protein